MAKQGKPDKPTAASEQSKASRKAPDGGNGDATKLAEVGRPGSPVDSTPKLAVVGMGASAGGLEAFKNFFTAMPPRGGMAFVLVQHLDPSHESLMVDLLTRYTMMKVVQVADRMPVEADHVYVIPPNKYLTISDGVLHLSEPIKRRGMRMPIDFFFRSLAEDQKERAICIILSGTGMDGTLGLKAVKGEGGMAMVQDPETCQYDGMPQSAIATGVVDMVLPVEMMPEALLRYVEHFYIKGREDRPLAEKEADHLKAVLAVLRTRTNHDFRCYKETTLNRRIQRRMGLNQVDKLADYANLLRENPAEIKALYKDLLIGVTGFFRDPDAFAELDHKIIRQLLESKEPDAPLRIWVPGCASGEEAYSLAMLFHEHFSKERVHFDLQIFASDIDEEALEFARQGVYPESIAADVDAARLRQFFVSEGETYHVGKLLRDSVVFAVQNLISDPPFSKLDLVSCRNLLIYLAPEVQAKVISLFHFALNDGGFLFLGPSETVGQQNDLFDAVSKKWRLYRRIGTVHRLVDFPIVYSDDERLEGRPTARFGFPRQLGPGDLMQQALVQHCAPASVLVNRKHEVLVLHGPTEQFLQLPNGELTHDLAAMTREGLRIKLRGAVHRAIRDETIVTVDDARVKREGKYYPVKLTVIPLKDAKSSGLLLVTFENRPTAPTPVTDDTGTADDEPLVKQLEYELSTTKEDLQSTIEELETSNEELKASNEEVMSMNEELQSSNEELETSKEELQSLNEELNTVNNQLQDKVQELEGTNNDLLNLLSSTDIATVFLSRELELRRFTPASSKLLNLLPSDVGRPLGHITRNFSDDALMSDAQQVLAGRSPAQREVQTDDSRWYMRRVLPYRTRDDHIEGVVITLDDITELKQKETELRRAHDELEVRVQRRTAELSQANQRLENEIDERKRIEADLRDREARLSAILMTAADGIITIDEQGAIQSINPAGERLFGYAADDLIGQNVKRLMPPPYDGRHDDYLKHYRETGEKKIIGIGRELSGRRQDGSTFPLDLSVSEVCLETGRLFTGIVRDVSERKRAEEQMRLLSEAVRNLDEGVVITDAELDWPGPQILFVNEAMSRISGYASDEMIGQTPRIFQGERTDRKALDVIRKTISAREPCSVELLNYRKDGSTYNVELFVSPVKDDQGRVTHFISVHHDITQRKHSEQRVLQSERLAAIGQTVAGLAHESRNALQRSQSCLEMLRINIEGDPEAQELIDRTQKAQDHLYHLYEEVCGYASPIKPQREVCDLAAVWRETWSHLTHSRDTKNVQLEEQIENQNLLCEVDRHCMQQVFRNILENAIHACPDPGKVVIRCTATGWNARPALRISVWNDGPAFTPEEREKIFDPFFTTKTHGTGLGMAIVKRIVLAHDGDVTIGESAGAGAEILITLPREAP